MRLDDRGYLLYDGDCGICRVLARRAQAMDSGRHVLVEPYQAFTEADLAEHGLSYAKCDHAVQLVTRDGKTSGGAWAVNRFLIHHFPWSLAIVVLYLLPVLLLAEMAVYAAVARNRHTISRWLGLSACKVPEGDPDP